MDSQKRHILLHQTKKYTVVFLSPILCIAFIYTLSLSLTQDYHLSELDLIQTTELPGSGRHFSLNLLTSLLLSYTPGCVLL